jgi:long-subunit acyl-CoA synthetase (AMP-forming)
MTETASLITAGKTTLGHPLPGKELKIKEDHEILVKGDSLFLGYGINPKPFLEDGYFATRDLGAYDPKLGLIYLGRKDRMFTKGGENIYPEKLENLLHQNPKLIRSYILGLDHEEYGMLIGAFIEPFNPSLIKELNQTIENTLGKFFTIHHFFPFPEDGSLKPSLPSLKSLAMSQINSVSPL